MDGLLYYVEYYPWDYDRNLLIERVTRREVMSYAYYQNLVCDPDYTIMSAWKFPATRIQ